jgi:hypothetical protein
VQETYREHIITASAVPLIDNNEWQPLLIVTWTDRNGELRAVSLDIRRTFTTRDEAECKGVLFVKKWIDDGKPPLL